MTDYAWTRWLAVAVLVKASRTGGMGRVDAWHRLPIAIIDLARAEYVRGQVEMRERAAYVARGAVRLLEPEGGE